MSFINNLLKVFVGDKSKKDIKEIQPIVDQILKIEPTLINLSHDELRAKTGEFKSKIAAGTADINKQISALEADIEATTDIDKKEELSIIQPFLLSPVSFI